jgi:hypothetical protein
MESNDDEENSGKMTPAGSNSAGNFQTQILTYSNKIQDLLQKIQANIQESKFIVERTDDGIKFDIALKATLKQNPTTPSKTTTSSEISE